MTNTTELRAESNTQSFDTVALPFLQLDGLPFANVLDAVGNIDSNESGLYASGVKIAD